MACQRYSTHLRQKSSVFNSSMANESASQCSCAARNTMSGNARKDSGRFSNGLVIACGNNASSSGLIRGTESNAITTSMSLLSRHLTIEGLITSSSRLRSSYPIINGLARSHISRRRAVSMICLISSSSQ